jgi:hypothetical protein
MPYHQITLVGSGGLPRSKGSSALVRLSKGMLVRVVGEVVAGAA